MSDPGPRPAIVTEGLTKRFGAFTAVDQVDLVVEAGEVFGFLGSNGCGKSTTIRMLCGLLQPSAGNATVAGYDVRREPERIRERVGYVAQFFNLYGDLTVEENLRFYGGVYGVPPAALSAAIDRWCDRLALDELRGRLAGQLSTGAQRTLGLAAAVLHNPAVLLLDEPTSGVDPLARREFFAVIGELAQAGTSVLVTTHVMDEAERCGRLALMNRGRILVTGTPAELKARGARAIWRLGADAPARALELAEQHPAVEAAALFADELQFTLADGAAGQAEAVAAALRAAGLAVAPPQPVRPTIEHAFLELVRRDELTPDTRWAEGRA